MLRRAARVPSGGPAAQGPSRTFSDHRFLPKDERHKGLVLNYQDESLFLVAEAKPGAIQGK